jgi:hypothetical protein
MTTSHAVLGATAAPRASGGTDPLCSADYVRDLKRWIEASRPHSKPGDKELHATARRLTLAARPKDRQETGRMMSDAVHYLRAHVAAGRKVGSALTHAAFAAYIQEAKERGPGFAKRVRCTRVKRALARYLNEPDPIDLILVRARGVKLSDDQLLDRYSHSGIPDELWQPVYGLVREPLLAKDAKGRAKRDYLGALRSYMLWRLGQNLSVAPEDLFSVTDLRRYEFRRATAFNPHGVATYRSKLRYLARIVAPALQFPPCEPLPLSRHRPETYVSIRVEDALTLARSQPNDTIRQSLLAFIHFAAGSPAPQAALPLLRGTDVVEQRNGAVTIRHGRLDIPVHRDHATEFRSVAAEAKDNHLLMPHLTDREVVVEEMHQQVVGSLRRAAGQHRPTFSGLRRHYTARAMHESGVIAFVVARGTAGFTIDHALVEHVLGEQSPAEYLAARGAWLGAS